MPTKSNYSAVNNTYNGASVQSQNIHNMASQTVRQHQNYGYDELTHGQSVTGLGHFNIMTAYPHYQQNCDQFVSRSCN